MIYQTHNSTGNRYYQNIVYDNFNFVLHVHKFPEIIFVMEGEVQINVAGEVQTAQKGDFAIVLGNLPHSYRTLNSSKVWVSVFSSDFISGCERLKTEYSTCSVFKCDDITRAFLIKMLVENHNVSYLELKAALYTAMSQYEKNAVFKRRSSDGGAMDKILIYIADNFSSPITMSDMAKALGYEAHYLSRKFNALFNCGFSSFINKYRVDAAKEMLLRQSMPINIVAACCGFGSVRNFNRVFKAKTDLTPRQFIKLS